MEELHTAIAVYLRRQCPISAAKRERCSVPRCQCRVSIARSAADFHGVTHRHLPHADAQNDGRQAIHILRDEGLWPWQLAYCRGFPCPGRVLWSGFSTNGRVISDDSTSGFGAING